mmetsp:Transcript_32919/g.48689  ORF Transcript_32919/g.48689 Transcript_32919/m.48689 type:complete len:80 (+) Transcript_32919:199-438(+)
MRSEPQSPITKNSNDGPSTARSSDTGWAKRGLLLVGRRKLMIMISATTIMTLIENIISRNKNDRDFRFLHIFVREYGRL